MSDVYTYVARQGNSFFSRGYHVDGSRFNRNDRQFQPTLFITSSKQAKTEWSDLHGKPLYPVQPGTVADCKDYIDKYSSVEGFEVHGMTNWVTQYISDKYPTQIKPNMKYTRTYFLDIETETSQGFPDINTANERILLITIFDTVADRFLVYSSRDFTLDHDMLLQYKIDPSRVQKSVHSDEFHMLKAFIIDWANACPDAITGWNTEFFDIPYLVRRCKRVLGDELTKRLSPWGQLREREVTVNGDKEIIFDLVGVNHLDYIALMKKYTYDIRDSWKLDNVAFDVLGMRKVDLDGSFKDQYTNQWNSFVIYNVVDVALVVYMEAKEKLIDLAFTIAYDSKINPDEVFSQIRSWDSLLHHELKQRYVVVPSQKRNARESFEGAFVKDPQVGKHKWVVSFDLQSLYPHLMMWANISPETMQTYRKHVSVDRLLDHELDTSDLKDLNYAMTANGVCFDRARRGFIAETVERIYNDRSKFKKQMLKLEQEYQQTKNESLIPEINSLYNLQLARKIQINSVYGAMGSPFFRYYSREIAEGITTSGQLAIRWVSRYLNDYLNKVCKTEGIDYTIYSDTDSVYLTLETLIKQTHTGKTTEQITKFIDKFCAEVLQKVINKAYDDLAEYMNAYQQKLIMKREVIADVGLFIAKKRYAMSVLNSEGVQYAEPKIKVTGLELVRSSTPAVIRTVLKDGVKQVLYGTESETQKFIAEFRKKFMTLSVAEIAIPRGVNGLKTYAGSPIYAKGCPIHVRAALLYNHYVDKFGLEGTHEKIKDGNKMKFVYLRLPNSIRENVIGFPEVLPPEFNLHRYVDYELMFEKTFEDAMSSLVKPLRWSTGQVSTLEDMFG